MTLQQLHMDGLFGKVTLLRGDRKMVKHLCMSLAAKLHAAQPLFIDSGNAFNPYFVQKHCRDPKSVLTNILISRPFTIHQLKSLVFNLDELAERHKIIIISSIDHLFRDADAAEGEFVLEQTISQLQHLAQKHGLSVFVGYSGDVHFSLIEPYVDYAYTV